MVRIELNPQGEVIIDVDTTIYDETVLSKMLYWWTADYLISRSNNSNTHTQTIVLSKGTPIEQEEFTRIGHKINADLIDYKNRQIISSETRDLRNLLYAKAFANNDDFVEFDFKD